MLTHLFTILFTLSVIFIASIIVLENRNPSRTVAWLVILTIFPIIGFVFYIFVGRNIRKRRRYKDKTINLNELHQLFNIPYDVTDYQTLQPISSKQERLVHLLLHNASLPMTQLNQVEILTNGEATFEKMFEELRRAEHHIHFITFILRNDQVGNELKKILIEKAKQGIKVRMIIDGLGSRQLSRSYKQELKEAGVELVSFSPILFPYLRKINYRNHRKITIIDGEVGFLGGLNVGDEYLGLNEKFGFWRDTHMMVKGDAVYFLQLIFLHDWRFSTDQIVRPEPCYFPKHEIKQPLHVQIAASGPDSDWEYILKVYFSLITQAKKTVYITTPYLIPDDSIAMALKTAALSGVDVRILVPGIPDHVVVHWASRSYYRELIEAGVKIYSYLKGFIHAKIIIVDGQVVTIGTANFDIRSFHHNFEVSGVIYDPKVADRLSQDFFEDLSYSEQLDLDQIVNRPIGEKARESIARLMSPLL
ncbi:cardiolipin synthase [Ammoniphilus oxalaticus]|uniref:Cardiolipin synthase n=1 Tax=Ammoniphilus oxalaticus TaxID=66863 RepID=A0A419SQQ4_9BACL|nr:cardiolipin synthase [Ammoniphilus oxalaticus]